MRGVGEATAAITLVNALPTGVGAAVGIELRAHAEVSLRRATSGEATSVIVRPDAAGTPLVRTALAAAIERFAPAGHVPDELLVRSDIPQATGLKSSSAVASAIVLAVAHAAGRALEAEAVAAASAQIARSAGVSATGAFDDALAGLVAGAVVTDNRTDRLLCRHSVDPGLSVALWIPPGGHPPSPAVRDRFATDPPTARAPVEAATDGRLWEAMELNADLVEAAMGYPYAELRRRLRQAGAIACGTSGLGPALAAVGARERIPGLLGELSGAPGRSFSVEFSRGDRAGGRS